MTQTAAGWHPEDIKAALVKRYGPICRLSQSWRFDRSAISRTLKNPRRRSSRVEARIAEALDVSPHELWPDRWNAHGPVRAVRRPEQTAGRTDRAIRQKGEPVQLSEPWYRENMPPFKAAIEDGMLILPMDRDIHGDLRSLKLVRGVARVPHRTQTDEGASRHGDAAIAACLAYAASRAPLEVFEYEAAGRPEEHDPRKWSDRARDWEEDNQPPGRLITPELRGGVFA